MNWKLESNEFYVIATESEKVDRFLSNGNYKFYSPSDENHKFYSPDRRGYCFVTILQHAMHFSTADDAKTLIKKLGSTTTEKLIVVKVQINFEKL